MTGLVSVVFVAGALVLALSALRGSRVSGGQFLKFAAIWVVIILGLAGALSWVGS